MLFRSNGRAECRIGQAKSGGGSLNDGLSKFAKAYFKIKDAGERINGGYFLIRLGMQGLTLGGQGLNKASGSLDENFDKIGKGLAKLEKGFADVKDNKSAAEVMKAIIEGEGKLVAALTQLEQVTQKAKQLDQQLHATIENTRIGLKAGLEAGGNAVYQNEKISGKYKVDELMDKLKQKADKLSANIDVAEKSRKKLLESLVKKTNFTKDGAKAGAKAIAGSSYLLKKLQVFGGVINSALSNKQIAHRLGLSEATVKTHVSTLIAKLGVHDRVGAVVHALRNRLV